MGLVAMVSGIALAWAFQAVAVSRAMRARGFDAPSWLVTSLLLGPAAWPLAFADVLRGTPPPEVVRWGTPGEGVIDVLVALESDALPEETVAQLRRLAPYTRRLVLARVIRAGGPRGVVTEARRFLAGAASGLRLDGAELQLLYGGLDAVVAETLHRHEFGIILRSDRPAELFDGDGARQDVRCGRDVSVA